MGSQAIDEIAQSIQLCQVQGIHICISWCNLSQMDVVKIYQAVAQKKYIGGISVMFNPFNFVSNRYLPTTDEEFELSLIASPAPITVWNNGPLSKRILSVKLVVHQVLALASGRCISGLTRTSSLGRRFPQDLLRLLATFLLDG